MPDGAYQGTPSLRSSGGGQTPPAIALAGRVRECSGGGERASGTSVGSASAGGVSATGCRSDVEIMREESTAARRVGVGVGPLNPVNPSNELGAAISCLFQLSTTSTPRVRLSEGGEVSK